MGLEAKIKPRTRGRSILNSAVATFKELPTPVRLLTYSAVGGITTAILTGCGTQSQPCEIVSDTLTGEKGGVCPLTTYHFDNPGKILSAEDQAKLRSQYGSDIKDVYQWYAVPKGSNSESVGDGTVAYSTYYFENGRSMVVFPSANEDYNSGKNEVHEFTSSLFETEDGKIIRSDHYPDELNPGKAISFLTIEYKKPEGYSLEQLAKDPSKLGMPEKVTVSNPPANEKITYNIDSNNSDDKKLIEAIANLFNPGTGVAHALGEDTATPPLAEAPTAIPTPMPVEVAPGEFIPANQITGFEARDTNGKLIYVEDIYGKWIKADHEVAIPKATAEDWTNLSARLGTDFAINTDGVIPGIEGVTVNKENGEVTFNFNGKGPERYSIANIKVQEINGVKRLLVAGYAWNADTKSWEVFNPGFPMESPEAQLGWFTQADVPNGNWLRWHQRATQNLDMNVVFANAVRPTKWISIETKSDRNWDYNFDGRKDIIHYDALWWESPELETAWQQGEKGFLKKEQFPNKACLSASFLTDSNAALFSNDMLNGDGTITSLPSVIDVPLIWERREITDIFSTLAEGCNVDQATIEAAGGKKLQGLTQTIWPTMTSYPDEEVTTWLTEKNGQFLRDPDAIERRAKTIKGNKLDQSASLDLWGAFIAPIEALQYWHK